MIGFDQIDALADMALPSVDSIPAETVEEIRRAVLVMLDRNPLFRRYIDHVNGRWEAQPRNRQPWHAEGERLYALWMCAMEGQPGGPVGYDANGRRGFGLGAVGMLLGAQAYLWSDAMEQLADATPIPSHVVSRDALPMPVMFWSRETAHVDRELGETNWMLLYHSPDGIRAVADLRNPAGEDGLLWSEIPYGWRYPDEFPEHTRRGIGAVLGRLAFLASPYVDQDAERLPRAWRREGQRLKLSERMADPSIRVVRLRRDARESVEREREDRAMKGERRSHWWVSGHHRAQWYPSQQAHRVIWIAPHLKGDLSKPLAQKIYAVVR